VEERWRASAFFALLSRREKEGQRRMSKKWENVALPKKEGIDDGDTFLLGIDHMTKEGHNPLMADSYMDHIPSHERERIRKRMRSPEEYERLRERVKGPEDLEREMGHNERMAEVGFALESDPKFAEHLRSHVEKDLAEQGIENVLEKVPQNPDTKKAIERGKFKLQVSSHPSTHRDQLMVVPEGNVQEKIPVKPQMSDRYSSHLTKGE
jgi:DNA-directed RNA polymerase sigma subunit (sigma70/sigma32)